MDGLKLHLGCGKVDFGEDWINIDQVEYAHVNHVCDVSTLPFTDNSASIIYACHVLEYFDWHEAKTIVLSEWKRVLKPGGILRLAVPDFDSIFNCYHTFMNFDEFCSLKSNKQ